MAVVAEHPDDEEVLFASRSRNSASAIEMIGPARMRMATTMRPIDDAAWEDVRDRSLTVISIRQSGTGAANCFFDDEWCGACGMAVAPHSHTAPHSSNSAGYMYW